ncbi:MAG: glycosyltransferase family 39 protein [Candidatus Roizmanbacteria bacterium]
MKNKIIFFVFFLAFLIRLISLNQSLWQDEATTARVVQEYSYQEIITKFSPNDFHPSLYYLFMKFWTNVFGYSEIALRMPSILFSLTTGYIIYLIAGIWGAVFFLFNPLIVYYSQEARMYMATTFFLTVALYYFEKMLRTQKSKLKSQNLDVLFFGIFISLGFLTFYGSIFLIAAMYIYLLYKKQYKTFIVSCFLFLVSFAFISPLLYQQLINAKTSFLNVANWSLVLGKANLKNLLLIPVKFSIGRIDFYPKWIYYLIAGGWTAFVLSKFKNFSLFLYLFIFPLFLGFIISFFTPLLQYFRFIYLIPIMAILLAERQPRRLRRQVLLIGGFLVFSLVYLLLPQFHREDWKSLVKSLPNDKSVYMILSSSDPLKYYNNNLNIKELKSLSSSSSLSREIIVIPFTAEVYGFDYKTVLKEKNFSLTNKRSFRELELETWKRIN